MYNVFLYVCTNMPFACAMSHPQTPKRKPKRQMSNLIYLYPLTSILYHSLFNPPNRPSLCFCLV